MKQEGKTVKYGPTDVYIAEPKQGAGDKSKAILLLTDVFGLGLVNNKLLADDWARAGFYTYVPDLFDGDYLTDARKGDPKVSLAMGSEKKGEVGGGRGGKSHSESRTLFRYVINSLT